MARNELAAVARLKIPVALRPPFSVWGYWAISGCPPCAADVDFIKSAQAEFQPPSYDGATSCTQGALGKLAFGVSFWGCVGCLLGEVSTPRGGCLLFRRPVAHEKVFRGESDGQEMTIKKD